MVVKELTRQLPNTEFEAYTIEFSTYKQQEYNLKVIADTGFRSTKKV